MSPAPGATRHLPPGLALGADPASVLRLMAEIATLADRADRDEIRPDDLSRRPDGTLVLERDPDPRRAASGFEAPEAARAGPTLPGLVFTIGAIGAAAALGGIEAVPDAPGPHAAWLGDVTGRLGERWARASGGAAAIEIVSRCLRPDPFERPHLRHLIEEIGRPVRSPPPAILSMRMPSVDDAERRTGILVVGSLLSLVLASSAASCAMGLWFLGDRAAEAQAPAEASMMPEPAAPEPAAPEPVEPEPVEPEPAPAHPEPLAVEPLAPRPRAAPEPAPAPDDGVRNDLIDPWGRR